MFGHYRIAVYINGAKACYLQARGSSTEHMVLGFFAARKMAKDMIAYRARFSDSRQKFDYKIEKL